MREKVICNGDRFGKWTILELSSKIAQYKHCRQRYYLCKCDCGTEREVLKLSLLAGTSKSCGCIHKEVSYNNRIFCEVGDKKISLIEISKTTGIKYSTLYSHFKKERDIEQTLNNLGFDINKNGVVIKL